MKKVSGTTETVYPVSENLQPGLRNSLPGFRNFRKNCFINLCVSEGVNPLSNNNICGSEGVNLLSNKKDVRISSMPIRRKRLPHT